jgi:membrane fusion protein (multidrug efflux system)
MTRWLVRRATDHQPDFSFDPAVSIPPEVSGMPRWRTVVVLVSHAALLLGAGLLLASCSADRGSERTGAGALADTATVAVVAVRAGSDAGQAFLTFLEPAVDAVVPARATGILKQVFVREGDHVAAGQALAQMESEEQRLEVEYTGALAEQAAAELERAEKGAAGQWISRQTLDAARAKARATRADLDLARLALDRRTLRAPVAGIVWQVRAEPERLARDGDILFRVSNPRLLHADLYLPPTLARRLRPGATVTLAPDGDADAGTLAAKVRAVSPIVDPTTGRVRVQLEADAGSRLLAGCTARAVGLGGDHLAGASAGAAAILPRDAWLERTDTGIRVAAVRGGVVRRVGVELGALRADGFEVLSGLAPGELVASAGGTPPTDGAHVRTRLAPGGAD